jgi:hypothetical protein
MIIKVKGYKYNNSKDVVSSIERLNAFYGIPVSEDSVTKSWCDYEIASLNNPVFYFIRYDKSMLEILGDPNEFDVLYEGPLLN